MNNVIDFKSAIELNIKNIRAANLKKQHSIPLYKLVEIIDKNDEHFGVRLFVVKYSRGDEGEPMYNLSFNKNVYGELHNLEKKEPLILHEIQLKNLLLGSILQFYPSTSLKIL